MQDFPGFLLVCFRVTNTLESLKWTVILPLMSSLLQKSKDGWLYETEVWGFND